MAELNRSTARLTDMLDYVLRPIQDYLDDHSITDVNVNPNVRCWVKRFSRAWEATDLTVPASDRRLLLDLLASRQMDELSAERPSLSTVLPSGARLEGTIPPLSENPTFAIRIRARSIYTLEDFARDGILTIPHITLLRGLVQTHRNIIIAGPTGSAKSTLLNALLLEVDTTERLVTIEDVPELQLTLPNLVQLWTREGVADLRFLVRKALRLQPDRIVIGEVRGAETLDFLKSLNTGHAGGMTTIHAESTQGTLIRLEMLVQEAVAVVPRDLIGDTVNAIVVMGSVVGGKTPRVVRIDAIRGVENGAYVIAPLGGDTGDA